MGREPERRRPPDIDFRARVQADELRFREDPDAKVEFWGQPAERSLSQSSRRNLPEKVKAEVTYRSIEVDYRLAAWIAREGEDGKEDADSPPEEK
jgi:hypothetical protein